MTETTWKLDELIIVLNFYVIVLTRLLTELCYKMYLLLIYWSAKIVLSTKYRITYFILFWIQILQVKMNCSTSRAFGFSIGTKIFLVPPHNTMLFLLINKTQHIKYLNSVIGYFIYWEVTESYWFYGKLFLTLFSNLMHTFNIFYKLEIWGSENLIINTLKMFK